MYLFILLLLLLVIFIVILILQNKKETFVDTKNTNIPKIKKKIACFPTKKDTLIKSASSKYPDKYGIKNDIPNTSESLVAKNEGNLHHYHINYGNTPMKNKSNDIPPPKNYVIIDRDFHTPREGSEIIPSPPEYNLVRVDNTDYFLVDTPDSIWRRVVPRE
jgi:hypothetical protein